MSLTEGRPVRDDVNARNIEFWNDLCGAWIANALGINDASRESLRKFDDWFFGLYPYVGDHIPFSEMRGRRVLEVGLGYGSVSQRLAESGTDYTGLDIAAGPVEMVNHRLRQIGDDGKAQQGSILNAPFADNSFDCVVAIGCYHHTGNLQRALDESYRILRDKGLLVVMVYNAYSYRRWHQARQATFRYLLWDRLRIGRVPLATAAERASYDLDSAGNEAPHTDFVSRHHLRQMCRRFSSFRATLANIDQEPPFARRPRSELLNTKWPAWLGLDIYVHARK
jgi:SAM-dependent methyltransferase